MSGMCMRFPGGKKKALTFSYDDGVEQDIRLIEIMRRNGLKGTFNINSGLYPAEDTVYPEGTIHRRLTRHKATAAYAGSGMEVAVHGLTHPFLEQLPTAACTYEICKDRENLETQFGTFVRGMALPFGTYNDGVIDIVKNCGIKYCRTGESTYSFQLPKDWLRLKPTCHHNDLQLMDLAEKFIKVHNGKAPWLFNVWGHSYEFDDKNNWNVIEEFARFIGNRDDIWYATNIEICDYVQSYESLYSTLDGRRLCNPTAQTVYLNWNGKDYMICPGEEICLN